MGVSNYLKNEEEEEVFVSLNRDRERKEKNLVILSDC